MAFDDLRDFIDALEQHDELKRIKFQVDPYLEITEFADRSVKTGGPALLFEKPKGSQFPVLINAFASAKRMEIALGVSDVEEIAQRIVGFLEMQKPEGLLDKLKMLPKLGEISAAFPKTVSSGPCKQVIRRSGFSLAEFPILHCWPGDAGRFITLPMVFSRDPETGKRNCGMYRLQVFDGQTTGMHWQKHKQGAEHYRRVVAEGKQLRMPVSVAIGSDPATTYSAILPLPPAVDEMMFAGFLRGKAVEMVKCETNDLEVPANSEIVLEGYVTPGELRREGPFGDHTGFYSLDDDYPVFHIECITHRKSPIYATTIVGPPPMEDFYMGKTIERIFLPLMRMQLPEVRDISMPAEGIFHNLILISIRKSYPGQARKVMHAIWGLGQAMFSKCIVVVDEDVDVQNVREVTWKALNNIDPQRDIEFSMGPIDSLDHASRMPNYGSKMGIDATTKWPSEGFTRRWPNVITMSPEVVRRVDELWKRAGLQ
ncbi:MAG: menaquinone biosynthesis decarboxylase [Acidobacteriaceae bacterium]|nr:menaquinone biosynthesis decarboxylase [Acidobacteriaceae bacterium]MBV9296941.1 menaquinone biosynthesis decarboxylase [Acidobacteriaceae bacterium]MBV9765571.1 menaquinone biosynthesis decarboxylase [Acidobacteriaceae bacterium]